MNKNILTGLLLLNAAAFPAAQAGTHLGQPGAASHVTLIAKTIATNNTCGMASFAKQALFRVNPDGTVGAAPFAVPAGQYLVVTDMEWTAQGLGSLGPLVANRPLRLGVNLVRPGVSTNVFTSAGVFIDASSTLNIFGGNEHLTAGFVVGFGTTLCPQAYQESQSSWAAARLSRVVVHGYLTP